tara:strand:+ start:6282 stop:6710 length:429 start_codon:yes stop_codon:yes gene_type:complete
MPREQRDFISKLIPPRLEEESPLTRAMVDIYEVLNKLVDHVNETKGGSAIKSMDESALPGTVRVRKKGANNYNVYIKGPDGWIESLNEYPEGNHYLWTTGSPPTMDQTKYVKITREGVPSSVGLIPKSEKFNGWRLIKRKDK